MPIKKKSKTDKKKTQKKSKADKKKTQKNEADEEEVKAKPWSIALSFDGVCYFCGYVLVVFIASQIVWVWLRRFL